MQFEVVFRGNKHQINISSWGSQKVGDWIDRWNKTGTKQEHILIFYTSKKGDPLRYKRSAHFTDGGVLILFYPIFLLRDGVKRLSRVSAAASSADLIAWAYILPVVVVSACPSLLATVVIGTPPAICKVAFVCLSE